MALVKTKHAGARSRSGRQAEGALRLLVAGVLLVPVSFLLSPSSLLLAGSGAAQDGRLPDPETFYSRVRENLARAERSNHLYAYKERRTDVHTNPFGRIGTGGTRLFEVYPSALRQLTYRRLVAYDGKPVAAAELADQDAQYRVRVAGIRQEIAARTEEERRRLDEESARARERGQRTIEDVVSALEFTLQRRAVYNGVPAVVITFAPQPDARPTTRQGRIAQKFAGTVWVDEQSAEVMRVEAKTIEDFSFGFGIVARLGPGTMATLTRRALSDGLWMPTRLTLTGSGRAALFLRKFTIDYVVEWFDYRRLPEDSLAPFLDPRIQNQTRSGPQ